MWLFLLRIISCLILINLISYTTAETLFCFLSLSLSLSLFFSTHTHPSTHWGTKAVCFYALACLHLHTSGSPPHFFLSTHPNSKQSVIQQMALTAPPTPVCASVSECVHAEGIQYSCKRTGSFANSKRAVMNLWHDYVLQKLCTLITVTRK